MTAMSTRTPESTATDADELIRFGRIASVDLAAARCTVVIDEDAAEGESPPLRWLHGRAGQSSTWSPPSAGEEVVVLCPAGEIGSGVILRGLSNTDNPPSGSTLTELVKFADGAVLSYDPEAHQLAFTLPAGATLAIEATGGVTIDGDVSVTGTLTASVDVVGGGKSLKDHTHTGVQGGSGTSGPPV